MEMEQRIAEILATEQHGSTLLGEGDALRLRQALEIIAQRAYRLGAEEALQRLMSVEEAAKALGVSRRRINEIIRRRGRGAVRVGGTWIVYDLEALRPGAPGWRKGRKRAPE